MLFISIFFIHLCVLVVPGSDFLLNSRTRLTGNKKTVIQVVTGTTLGAIIWALFSLLGLHLIFQYYPFLRELVLFGGLVYLFYLAFQIYRSVDLPLPAKHGIGHSYFFTGLLTNLTNPKALLYFSSIFSIIHFGSNPSNVFFYFYYDNA
ncbi:LysE family transporter [Commensalibacter sp. M0357]|uniref:LysE family transporter n=1 Tax=unclassified Commensalibacter TaxID=2630218 RepID=UPI0018DB17E5|nr:MULTISPECIES: LysE family transporter [unclassified Commensalibacter]MBI0075049.1 LysE family transporter [Commensalibacter sp. M0357]MBI0084891.1 LysE family transporter [Commensalibacter sp. M0355]